MRQPAAAIGRYLAPVVAVMTLLTAASLKAETWPAWRGANGRGVSPENNLPDEWSPRNNVAWQTKLPGRGNSSPAVTAERVYLTTQGKKQSLLVLAIDRDDGQLLWKRDVGRGKLAAFGPTELYQHRHNPATPTPVADGEHVWAFFGTGLLICLNRDGSTQWQVDLTERYGEYDIRFGMASSPRLWGDWLYLICIHQGPSYVVALDKSTGEEVWKTRREVPEATAPPQEDGDDAYSSPILFGTGKDRMLLVAADGHLDAYHPRTGKRLWMESGLVSQAKYGRILASPAVGKNVVVGSSSNPSGGGVGHAVAWKLTLTDAGKTKRSRLWRYKPFTPDAPTPVCYQGLAYLLRDDGVGSCLDAETGEVQWRKRVGKGTFRASPVAGDKKVYYLNLQGECTVMQAGRQGKILAVNKLPGTFFATPAISDGRLYLRGHHRLYAVGNAK